MLGLPLGEESAMGGLVSIESLAALWWASALVWFAVAVASSLASPRACD